MDAAPRPQVIIAMMDSHLAPARGSAGVGGGGGGGEDRWECKGTAGVPQALLTLHYTVNDSPVQLGGDTTPCALPL